MDYIDIITLRGTGLGISIKTQANEQNKKLQFAGHNHGRVSNSCW